MRASLKCIYFIITEKKTLRRKQMERISKEEAGNLWREQRKKNNWKDTGNEKEKT